MPFDTTLTIICTAFNAAQRTQELTEHLGEILNTSPKVEVVVVDDASTDQTWQALEQFQHGLSAHDRARLALIRHEQNRGLAAARNTGMQHASGRYVCFLDDDDALILVSLRGLLTILATSTSDLMTVNVVEESDAGERHLMHPLLSDGMPPAAFFQQAVERGALLTPAWAYLYSRHFIDRCAWQFPDGWIHEDCWSTPTALLRAQSISQFSQPFYRYRRRAGSLTLNDSPVRLQQRAQDLMNICDALFSEHPTCPAFARSALLARQFDLLAYACSIASPAPDSALAQRAHALKIRLLSERPAWRILQWMPALFLKKKHLRRVRDSLKAVR